MKEILNTPGEFLIIFYLGFKLLKKIGLAEALLLSKEEVEQQIMGAYEKHKRYEIIANSISIIFWLTLVSIIYKVIFS